MAALHAMAFAPTECWTAETFAVQLCLPGVFGLFVPEAGMVLARVAGDEAEILTIGVAPAARRAGHGRVLLAAAEARAAADGAAEMFLEVAADNIAAQCMYHAAGYKTVGRRQRYYPNGSDALVLARRLSPDAAKD